MKQKIGKKYCVVHGHFYQPPREDPWLNEIERQPSAAPFHDWNDRIFDECYRPNSFSRILDGNGEITAMSNNYSFMSFNFGPTLLSWLSDYHPTVYSRIVDADKRSCRKFDGHGGAVAQVYNHIIMPHASRKDKMSQIRWSKSFFKRHFGRDPEGMWLAETAINAETVECLVEEGLTFVILSPNQAASFRFMNCEDGSCDGKWIHTDDIGLDPRFPYRAFVDTEDHSKGHLDVFFFDEPLSRAVSFEDMLDNAQHLTHRLHSCYSPDPMENELVNIATDGETFGHHKKNADMCLAFFFNVEAEKAGMEVVNYSYYLSQNTPRREVRLKNAAGEGSAWSCAHGTGRWIRDCGCNTGGLPGWNQKWRGPLREAMNSLHYEIDQVFTREFINFFDFPQEILDGYEPCFGNYAAGRTYLEEHMDRQIPENKVTRLISLLEAERYIIYGFTSCAWFFNDISGIETVQNLRYAFRAWQLTWPGESTNVQLEDFERILERAVSNHPGVTGLSLLRDYAYPMRHHMKRAAFTATVSSYIHDDAGEYLFSAYKVNLTRGSTQHVGDMPWILFDAEVEHTLTKENLSLTIALHSKNGFQIDGSVLPIESSALITSEKMLDLLLSKATHRLNMADIFGSYRETITDRFVDDFVSDTILDYMKWAGLHNNRLSAITQINGGLPQELASTVAFFLHREWDLHIVQIVKQSMGSEAITESLREVSHKADCYGITLEKSDSAFLFSGALKEDLRSLDVFNISLDTIALIRKRLELVKEFEIPVQFALLQDTFYLFYKQVRFSLYLEWDASGRKSDEPVVELLKAVNALATEFGYSTAKTAL